MKTVVVGLSGGVDSSVSALLLKRLGYNVIGLFMKNWEEEGQCKAAEDYEDVVKVSTKLGIPHYSVNFTKEYRETVFQDFLVSYKAGYTPNPDILCNREIKFKVFLEKALELGADYLATGHYCQRDPDGRLLRGEDPTKDQSYFLHAVSQKALQKVLFPIGDKRKSEVRKMAKEQGLATAEKKDSTGICFIGKRAFKPFLEDYLQPQPGPFETLDGTVVGTHDGIQFYTIGQRKGMKLGGEGDAWYVVDKDVPRNAVIVVRGANHPALFSDWLRASHFTWIAETPLLPLRCTAKVRYRQEDTPCTLLESGEVLFDKPQRAVTPGQSIVFYEGKLCLGGAIIRSPRLVGSSLFSCIAKSSRRFAAD
ncbi:MAG: tRNA 2-thiouridine(34) synthase MnmA [Chlamydiae bacterium RIFCSPHIGHO2_12_FULL_44_59]|nr:MAG: tRNA 2-thiouridine(34) synthase MnmA [Chlamydiae bacterium RIFCSPHIGHO2_01_FULL_44_39]OGN57030.1 MAG: tRNA 2-thiouridine(34) synthase MnmA [Chlamydiae bacterium RIFCSPHIGHO2_02_FULL_45_9]OGN61001.1 MAG: tRNA 2-thiouridine(34) synthase MnmA [Chlamydiae bacterium RIFCSPHIGHO2_12_FULL_44_59]OGN66777.1 MAG: tRNA 2-thiouridine(34) synthase MnmA [Chlamydiae bacterium RIFCSPLOWO2_01_FULL_44_52]OGN69971.1 MAG: tRNA 2-thiouridine(34) synthase MnmA [Chlamydiae bacterium RIFCSPLOWO2_02_FULL_45_22]